MMIYNLQLHAPPCSSFEVIVILGILDRDFCYGFMPITNVYVPQ